MLMKWFQRKKRKGVATMADVLKSLNEVAEDMNKMAAELKKLTMTVKRMNEQDAKR